MRIDLDPAQWIPPYLAAGARRSTPTTDSSQVTPTPHSSHPKPHLTARTQNHTSRLPYSPGCRSERATMC
eukprot:353827-Chlamydomonas_euryale.AAC.3